MRRCCVDRRYGESMNVSWTALRYATQLLIAGAVIGCFIWAGHETIRDAAGNRWRAGLGAIAVGCAFLFMLGVGQIAA